MVKEGIFMADFISIESVNPACATARESLYWLKMAEVENASAHYEILGIAEEDINAIDDASLAEKLKLPYTVVAELSYEAINRVIRESGCKNVLDVGCGYSPRGILLAREGYKYVGIDLPPVIDGMHCCVDRINSDESVSGSVEYIVADATNDDSMKDAASRFDGDICVIAEGLIMHLSHDEMTCVYKNIRSILEEHGGCFISTDCNVKNYRAAVINACYGPLKSMNIIHQERKLHENTEGIFTDVSDDKHAFAFLTSVGLKVEAVPAYKNGKLGCLANIDSKISAKIYDKLDKQNIWILGVDENYDADCYREQSNNIYAAEEEEQETEEVVYAGTGMNMELDGTTLRVVLSGRIDSLVAPQMLERYQYESQDHTIEKIVINMKDLQYISSAGLRILVAMKKDKQVKEIVGNNISDDVMEIFQTTGIDAIFDLIR